MTRTGDALAAAALGVDAIGLVFTRRSPRFVDIALARAIRRTLPPYVDAVALFMDDDADWIVEVEAAVRPSLLQFHGAESAAFCAGFATPYVKTVAMGSVADAGAIIGAAARDHAGAAGLLLDGHVAGQPGGSGQRFDWSRMPRDGGLPLIVAGGLHAGNVGEAIRAARPWGVDVASGIESAPGIKDLDKLRAFVDAVRVADADSGNRADADAD